MAARSTTRVVRIGQVVDLLQVSHAPAVVQVYAEAMRAGQSFPPVSVIRLGPRYIVTDGHKRFTACKVLGKAEVEVELWSAGRLIRDLGRQALRHLGAAAEAGANLARGGEGRREAARFAAATAAHWLRIARSLWSLIRSRQGPGGD